MIKPFDAVERFLNREASFRNLIIGTSAASVLAAFVALRIFSGRASGKGEEEIRFEQLPRRVQQTLLRQMSGGRLLEIEREWDNGRVVYEAEFEKDGRVWEVEIDPAGRVLEIEDEGDD